VKVSIKIEQINGRNIGPIQEINENLKDLNLFYGPNEIGKTYLVEFIIKSIFRTKEWSIRPLEGRGKVKVKGISDDITEFFPSSSKKIEDYIEEDSTGLPAEFSKLLVVKGAELELKDRQNADKQILKKYLSSKEILDEVERNIKYETYKKASIDSGIIDIAKRGGAKDRIKLKKEIKKIDELNSKIEEKVLGGELKQLNQKKDNLEKKEVKIQKAKRYKAYTIDNEIKELNQKKENIPEDKIDEVSEKIKEYDVINRDLEKKKSEYKKQQKKAKHYEWLEKAIHTYDNLLSSTTGKKPSSIYLWFIFGLIILGGIFTLLNYTIPAFILIILSIIPIFIYSRKFNNYLSEKTQFEEMEKIEQEYKNRFDKKMSGLVDLKEKKKKKEKAYHNRGRVKEELDEIEKDLIKLEVEIKNYLKNNFDLEVNKTDWNNKLSLLKKKRKDMVIKINTKNKELLNLNVDEKDYIKEKPDLEYDEKEWRGIVNEIDKIEAKIENLEETEDDLREEAVELADANYNDGWNTIISRLNEKRNEDIKEYKSITSRIEGVIAVMDVLDDLRETEDKNIKKNLESDLIQKPLKEITRRYDRFKLDDENLFVLDDFNEFPLNDLSTGAQHQALIALRMGFASRILKENNMFLILDDAFQYSDYDRRKNLVEKVSDLCKKGWQVLYFTMDDHIRDLFQEKGKDFLDNYKYIELEKYTNLSR